MGLLTKEVEVYLGNGAIRRYEELGYKIPRVEKIYYHPNGSVSHRRYSVPRGTYITVNVEDLPPNSCLKVDCECDDCYKPLNMTYQTYLNTNHDGLTYCKSCAYKHTHIGENNPRWNPNKTDEERIKGRTSDSYLKFIRTVLERDKFTCVCCDKYTTKHDLEVHHLNGYEWFEEGRTDINNAVTLCKNCHSNFHSTYGYGGNTKEQFEEWIKKSIDYIQNLHTELSPTKRIYCYETNTVYESARHTKEFLGLNGTSGIYACCLHQKLNRKYNGYHFLFEDEYLSMTKEERANPDLINKSHSRKSRLVRGSGRSYQEINNLTKRFEEMKKQMQGLMGMDEEHLEKVSKGQAPMPMMKPMLITFFS